MRKLKRWVKTPLGISMTSTLFGLILPTVLIDLFKSKPILTTIWWVITIVWKGLLNLLNLDLKLWWVLLGLTVLFLGLYIYVRIYEAINSDKHKAPFLKYTQDTFCGWKWSWTWERQYNGKFDIENLHSICSKCDTPLVIDRFLTPVCPRCNFRPSTPCPDIDTVKILIHDNVRKGLIP